MKYTENYHLPQWVKTDRIMMDDFNAAMANLESGLSEGKTVRDRTVDRVYRLAYNHYCAVQEMDPFPSQIGIFHQNFVKDQTDLTGTIGWTEARFGGKGGGTLAASNINQYWQELTPLKIDRRGLSYCSPLTAKFKAPAAGYMSNYALSGNYYNGSASNYRIRITLTNQDTGAVEYSAVATLKGYSGSSGGFTHPVQDAIYFQGNTNYLVKIEPLDVIWDAEASIVFTNPGFMLSAIASAGSGIITAQRTIHEPLGGKGGLAILRCATGGDGGMLQFQWDGEEKEPSHSRLIRMSSGHQFQELVYVREDPVPENSTISLRFECAEEGSILLHDWGVILF